ncbi:MAG: PAQR family membrane homeostasis protein TrhA [Nitriliruptorales bacterium]
MRSREIADVGRAAVRMRPRLRGVLHTVTTPAAILGAWVLWRAAHPTMRTSVLVFGVFLVGLLLTSSLYHVPRWTCSAKRVLGRVDVAVIPLFIAATYTPFAVHALDGGWRTWSLTGAWAYSLGAAALALSPLRGPRWTAPVAYVAFGWLGVVPLVRILGRLPWQGLLLVTLGGVAYSLGALVYARRRPDPWPSWFGFHEVFHVFVLVGIASHFVAIWRYTLPLAA